MDRKKTQLSAYCNDVLGAMDGVEIAQQIAARKISPSEAVRAAIDRA